MHARTHAHTQQNTQQNTHPCLASLLWFHWLITSQGPRGPNSDHMSILCMFTVQQSTGMNVIIVSPQRVYFLHGVARSPAVHLCSMHTNDTISIALKQADCVAVIDVDVLIIAPAAWQPPKPTTTCPHSSQATCSLCLPSCLQVAFVRPWMTSACKLKVTNKEITKTLQYIHDCCTRIRLASASF